VSLIPDLGTARDLPLAPCAGVVPPVIPGGVPPKTQPKISGGPLLEIFQAKPIVETTRVRTMPPIARGHEDFGTGALVAGGVADFIAAKGQNLKFWPRIAYIDEASLECVENHLLVLAALVPDVPVRDVNYDAAAEV
jgi:hypothetical protein